jgi:predicted nucleic acid-binding protein
VKLYIEEISSDLVKKWVSNSNLVATCRVAFPETISALNRRLNNGDLSRKDYGTAVKAFIKEWPSFVAVDFDEIEAGHLVEKYNLRGFDAVHLSSVKNIKKEEKNISLSFSSFDDKLNTAAEKEGLFILKSS